MNSKSLSFTEWVFFFKYWLEIWILRSALTLLNFRQMCDRRWKIGRSCCYFSFSFHHFVRRPMTFAVCVDFSIGPHCSMPQRWPSQNSPWILAVRMHRQSRHSYQRCRHPNVRWQRVHGVVHLKRPGSNSTTAVVEIRRLQRAEHLFFELAMAKIMHRSSVKLTSVGRFFVFMQFCLSYWYLLSYLSKWRSSMRSWWITANWAQNIVDWRCLWAVHWQCRLIETTTLMSK